MYEMWNGHEFITCHMRHRLTFGFRGFVYPRMLNYTSLISLCRVSDGIDDLAQRRCNLPTETYRHSIRASQTTLNGLSQSNRPLFVNQFDLGREQSSALWKRSTCDHIVHEARGQISHSQTIYTTPILSTMLFELNTWYWPVQRQSNKTLLY